MDTERLQEIGLAVRETEDGVVADLDLDQAPLVNPLTRAFIQKVTFRVEEGKLIAFAPPELAWIPPLRPPPVQNQVRSGGQQTYGCPNDPRRRWFKRKNPSALIRFISDDHWARDGCSDLDLKKARCESAKKATSFLNPKRRANAQSGGRYWLAVCGAKIPEPSLQKILQVIAPPLLQHRPECNAATSLRHTPVVQTRIE
jgi:hypothetical protein